ncbi:hypothetical protein H4R23_001060 [Coemansia sp. Cherry 401B]|nr:hypothetical protein H4R23_001060 [Coemansia sp. Cherry 401B]
MEEFRRAIKPGRFALNGWDMSAAFTNIPYIYYFKNTNSSLAVDFMPSSKLRASFLKTLEEFPILVGHVKTDADGRTWVDVNARRPNMPEYLESHSTVHFCDLESAGYDWNAFPGKIATVGAFPSQGPSGTIKLANVSIIRLRENSGLILFVSASHYVVDGVGYCAFINRWAEICRWMQNGATDEMPPDRQYTFDRLAIDRCLPASRVPMSRAMTNVYDTPSYLGHFLAWISPKTRGDITNTAGWLMNAVGHVFHISSASLDALRTLIGKYAAKSQRLTDNDMLTVLIGHAIAKGIKDDATGNGSRGGFSSAIQQAVYRLFGQATDFQTMMVLDIRPRISGLAETRYAGNCVTCIPVVSKTDQIAHENIPGKDLADLCAQTRFHIRETTAELIAEYHHIINKTPAMFGHAMAKGITTVNKVVVSNQSRFSLYQNDFGNGIPAWVSPIPVFYANFASILPVHPSANGLLHAARGYSTQKHFFDTNRLVVRLEREGFSKQQSESIVTSVNAVLGESTESILSNIVTKAEQDKTLYMYKVDFAQLKSEIQMMEKTDFSMMKAENERLQGEVNKLKQKLREEITRTQAGVRLDMSLEKGRARDEQAQHEIKIRETDAKIEQEISGLRTQMESIKFSILQYMIGTITGTGALILAYLRMFK